MITAGVNPPVFSGATNSPCRTSLSVEVHHSDNLNKTYRFEINLGLVSQ